MGVIIAGLEVIEAGFEVVDVATVAKGVILVQSISVGVGTGTGTAGGVTPSIVGIRYYRITLCVQNGDNVTLKIDGIEIRGTIEVHRQRRTQRITSEAALAYRL